MAKKTTEKTILLSDAIKEYGDCEGFIVIHKHNVPGKFKYKIDEISDKLLANEVITIQKGWSGVNCKTPEIVYIIK